MSTVAVSAAGHRYRVDTFVVPVAARDEFLYRVRETHSLLQTQPGFVQDQLLERTADDGSLTIVTLVEWESETAMAGARAAVAALRAKTGFDPRQLIEKLSIRADLAEYRNASI